MSNIGGLCKIHANYDLAIEYYKDALEYVGDKDRAGLLFNP